MQTIIIYIHPSRQTSSIIHVHVIPDIFNYDISAKFITHKKTSIQASSIALHTYPKLMLARNLVKVPKLLNIFLYEKPSL